MIYLLLALSAISVADETTVLDSEKEYLTARSSAGLNVSDQLSLSRIAKRLGMKDRHTAHVIAAARLDHDAERATSLRQSVGQSRVGGAWLDAAAVRRLDRIDLERRRLAKRHSASVDGVRRALSEGRLPKAARLLTNIEGPHAAWLVWQTLRARSLEAETLAVETIGGRSGYVAAQALAELAVESEWPSVRREALSRLSDRDLNDFVPIWLARLHTPPVMRTDHASVNNGELLQTTYEAESWAARKRLTSQTLAVYRRSRAELTPQVLPNTPVAEALIRGDEGVLIPGDIPAFSEMHTAGARAIVRGRMHVAMTDARIESEVRRRGFEREVRRSNRRVFDAIESVASVALADAEEAWDWWAAREGVRALTDAAEKDLIEVSEFDQEVVTVPSRIPFHGAHSCFAAGTAVLTPDGPRPIEALTIGDRVVSQDVETGEVRTAVVLQPTSRMADEHFEMHVDGERFLVSGGHPLWEVGHGWRRVRHVEPDRELSTMGGVRPITRLARLAGGDPRSQEPVYNLIVDGTHTYFVGDSRLLVHDDTIPLPTDCTQPGVAVN